VVGCQPARFRSDLAGARLEVGVVIGVTYERPRQTLGHELRTHVDPVRRTAGYDPAIRVIVERLACDGVAGDEFGQAIGGGLAASVAASSQAQAPSLFRLHCWQSSAASIPLSRTVMAQIASVSPSITRAVPLRHPAAAGQARKRHGNDRPPSGGMHPYRLTAASTVRPTHTPDVS
jgi:hypothetical protein